MPDAPIGSYSARPSLELSAFLEAMTDRQRPVYRTPWGEGRALSSVEIYDYLRGRAIVARADLCATVYEHLVDEMQLANELAGAELDYRACRAKAFDTVAPKPDDDEHKAQLVALRREWVGE